LAANKAIETRAPASGKVKIKWGIDVSFVFINNSRKRAIE
jgi:hypothetical protein